MISVRNSYEAVVVHREESAVLVTGFPACLNEFGLAQLFPGLKITGVIMSQGKATVTFATKFLAYQVNNIRVVN